MSTSISSDLFRLPVEIYHEIVAACVRSRGIRRALRLRLVSRTFDAVVLDAIFHSWDLLCDNTISYWFSCPVITPKLAVTDMFEKHFVHHILSRSALPDRNDARIVRRIAEEIARRRLLRSEETAATKPDWPQRLDTEYRRCVTEMCGWYRSCLPDCVDAFSSDVLVSPWSYDLWLGFTAAYLGEVEIMEELLAQSRSPDKFIYGLTTAAALSGRLDLLVSLIARHPNPPTLDLIGELSSDALQANSSEVLEYLLELATQTSRGEPDLHKIKEFHRHLSHGCSITRSPTCFQLAYKYHADFRGLDDFYASFRMESYEKHMLQERCILAACNGQVEFLDYLSNKWPHRLGLEHLSRVTNLGEFMISDFLFTLVHNAARFCRLDVLEYLLEQRHAKVRAEHVVPAMASGSVRVVELVMAYYMANKNGTSAKAAESNTLATQSTSVVTREDFSLKRALYRGLLEATEREHDAMVRWGLAKSRELGDVDFSDISHKAGKLGLDSMVNLLRDDCLSV